MKVRLLQTWISPDANRYRRSPPFGYTEVPEQFRDILPKGTVFLDDKAKQPEPEPEVAQTFAQADEARQSDDAVLARIKAAKKAAGKD